MEKVASEAQEKNSMKTKVDWVSAIIAIIGIIAIIVMVAIYASREKKLSPGSFYNGDYLLNSPEYVIDTCTVISNKTGEVTQTYKFVKKND